VAGAKKDLESGDAARMKTALENLQKLGAEFYAEAQKAAGPQDAGSGEAPPPETGGASRPEPKKADVVDADFEVVDDDKKK
jgi:molecular chaperone DnaK